ncbi:hypothetical protein [Vibrio caribbeanicus]|uniref:hypothetical protein n=1 Tax=Vibrio caribbeanicus TaxID=701175 RepID=UPI00228533CA|nr:hypothetical protein [Vibrio caribbeanicus]MCY9845755.1 hypothetical protein [Vibrio caribbeanicus]
MRYESLPVAPSSRQETTKERAARHQQERRAELTYNASDEKRWAENSKRVLAQRKIEQAHVSDKGKLAIDQRAYDLTYGLTEKESNEELSRLARQYRWDTSQQENISIAILTIEEANEYLDLLIKDTHGELSSGKDYTGMGMGLKGAYEVAKDLGGWGVTAKAVNINGVMNIEIKNYKPRYLDLGIRWQEATPQMLKIGHALNTVKGNVSFLKGNIYIEIVFSGAVNAVDYMLHDEKTLGEVVGQLSSDVTKGVVAGVAAQGLLLASRAAVVLLFGFSLPAAVGLGLFAYSAFKIGGYISDLDNKYEFTEPMKKVVEDLID